MAATLVTLFLSLGLAGCGSGGYAGGGIVSLSKSTIVLDAGQSIAVTADLADSANVTWSISQSGCGSAGCGILSTSTGTAVTYTAPPGVTTPIHLTLTASIPNTKDTQSASITVNPDPSIQGVLPSGTVGTAYSATLTASGGTPTLTMSAGSNLPSWLTFDASTGVLSGTPTTIGTYNFTVQVTDESDVPDTVSVNESITVSTSSIPLTLTGGPQPPAVVGLPYSTVLPATGGVTPYTWSISAGSLPGGLNMNPLTGVISGAPTTAGSYTFTVKVTDDTGQTATAQASIAVTTSIPTLSLTTTALPNGTVGIAYTGTIGVAGGTAPYSCTIGNLPSGLSQSSPGSCTVTGTPTVKGTSTVTVTVTDSSNPQLSLTGTQTITINAAATGLSFTTTALPNGTVQVPYNATIGVTGGTSPYSCSLASGTMPGGLTLNSNCTVTGTPNMAGPYTISVTVTDSSNPKLSLTGPQTIVINPAQLQLSESVLPDGTVQVPYSATIGVTGGTAPYACSITAGTLPAGLTLTGCTVSGTPTTAGSSTVTVKVTDAGNPQKTTSGPQTITINPASLALTMSNLPDGTVQVPYTATIGITGGTSPYNCTLTGSIKLPAGLSLTSAGCIVSGTPTAAGSATVTVQVTDASNPQQTTTGPETIVIHPSGALSLTGTLPNATVNVAYSQTLNATGGKTPYSYSLTGGSLPAGLSLATDGTISGTPTAVGASVFTVTVTDSSSPQQTATNTYTLLVTYPSGPNDGELKGPYAYLFQGYDDEVLGVLTYQTAAVGSITADGTGVITSGEQTANHQSSNPAATTVGTKQLLGTYEIGADNTGMITITTFNADGSVDLTHTYAVSLKPPVSPATTYSVGSIIEYDSDQLAGTKGSGTLLAQTASAFATGLHGTYAFGLSGETSCLISCAVGIASGPVATVGEFAVDGSGNISSGSADANIAAYNYPNAPISGAYEPADSDGQVTLTMNNSSITDGSYPVDYVAYIVNANEVFVMSTDKHSSYSLLAGTAQEQTQTTFDNSSMSGPVIGYENAQVNPGLVGDTLQDVLNFSSATIFRAVGNGAGSCNTTNVDNAGLNSLVTNTTGSLGSLLGLSSANVIQGVLGEYDGTGTSSCEVNSNGRGVLAYATPPAPTGLIGILLKALLGTLFPSGAPAPRVFYLVSPNNGYFMESGYAGLGYFEQQTGSPFTLASLNGTYVESSIPDASVASLNSTGTVTFNGSGNVNQTLDENVGVGTINILQLGQPSTTTYSLSNPNGTDTSANTGRYLLGDGTTVVYAISPNRLVILNTSALQTAPTVSLAY